MTISVIIPVLNEAARIDAALTALAAQPGIAERIVVDGGSDDGTGELAAAHPGVAVVRAPRGRGTQLNAGAAVATGDVVWFVHADVELPANAAAVVRRELADSRTVAGAFRTRHVAEGASGAIVRALLGVADVRSRYARIPYGDQALFVRADEFARAGRFPSEPLMEDIALGRALRARGNIARAPERVRVSGRRFQRAPVKTALCWNLFPLLHAAGVSSATLARLYGETR